MKKIKVDCSMITRDPAEASKVSKNLEDLGYDGAYTFEGPHEPFLPLAAAALATEKLELSTSIAVAFSRNPMTLANLRIRSAIDVQREIHSWFRALK